MKYGFFGVLTLGILILLAPTPASATCIDFVDFCDSLQLTKDAAGTQFGLWNAECENPGRTQVIGRNRSFAGRPQAEDGTLSDFNWVFVLDLSNQTFDMYGLFEGSIFTNLTDSPYTVTPGDCTWALTIDKSTKPRLTD